MLRIKKFINLQLKSLDISKQRCTVLSLDECFRGNSRIILDYRVCVF